MRLKRICRIVTFVPPARVKKILQEVAKVTPLKYGKYKEVSWRSAKGVEQYRPTKGANPTKGRIGKLEKVPSIRVEFSVPRSAAKKIIERGIIPNHPWEEPVILMFYGYETRKK